MKRTRRAEPRITNPFAHPTRLVSLTVAAAYLECHRMTLHRWMRDGRIPFSERGLRRKIAVSDLVLFEARNARNVSRGNDKVSHLECAESRD